MHRHVPALYDLLARLLELGIPVVRSWDLAAKEFEDPSITAALPDPRLANTDENDARLGNYRWDQRWRGLNQLPAAA